MGYAYLENIELAEALTLYQTAISTNRLPMGKEEIAVQESYGRVTAEAVYAKISAPHFNACAMDGIALSAQSTFGATVTTPVLLQEGAQFTRVDTGDPLPKRFDAVVMIEDVIELGGGAVKLLNAATPWQHIRQIGEDLCAAEMILPSNTKVEAAAIGAMLAGGVLRLAVWRIPRVALIPTGDEIINPTDCPKEGELIEFNTAIFAAMLTEWGAIAKLYEIVPDQKERIRAVVEQAVAECDLIILNAGSSAGRADYSAAVIRELGQVVAHGIAIRPGKPTILGLVNSRPVIGVPGYPVSGMIVLRELVKPVLELLMNTAASGGIREKAVLSRKIVSSLKYQEFVRVKLGYVADKLIATPLNRGAGVVTSLLKADGLLEIPLNSEGYEAGQPVWVELLKNRAEIQNTMLVVGSHDPLIDVATDLVKKKFRHRYVASAHVGSMGGIMAVKRGEAHAAGVHLLDEATGEYNVGYIEQYFGKEPVLLVHCVQRMQGLMVAPHNPQQIRGLEDLAGNGVRFINRQKGSGTRILLDYLLRKSGLDVRAVEGYEREEFTHIAIATAVASGNADVGMGIYSAAKLYGLEFIPLCEEQYDFIIPERFFELETVRCFLEILNSAEFKTELGRMGGYNTEHLGAISRIDRERCKKASWDDWC